MAAINDLNPQRFYHGTKADHENDGRSHGPAVGDFGLIVATSNCGLASGAIIFGVPGTFGVAGVAGA